MPQTKPLANVNSSDYFNKPQAIYQPLAYLFPQSAIILK